MPESSGPDAELSIHTRRNRLLLDPEDEGKMFLRNVGTFIMFFRASLLKHINSLLLPPCL
jgi:hypothetical protein